MSATRSLKDLPLVRLPEPWRTTYHIHISAETEWSIFSLRLSKDQLPNSSLPPEPLHHPSLFFSDLVDDQSCPASAGDNSAWARFYRQSISHATWDKVPSVGQIWSLTYALVSMRPEQETFRLALVGHGNRNLAEALQATGLATPPPKPSRPDHITPSSNGITVGISRAAFWQGAASPFGPRAVWVAHPELHRHIPHAVASFPAFPHQHTVTFSLEGNPVHAQHPVRPPKPSRGAVIYSRYMPHLDEFFSMVHLDPGNETHVKLFHDWQNDPRVSQGWNQSGTLEEHRDYLHKLDQDPHQMAVLAKFDNAYFAYFEIYWAKEDHMGTYLSPSAGAYDRGRHSLVGDARYRGPHRAAAWWASLVHYLFLDEPRTMCAVGEPRANSSNTNGNSDGNGNGNVLAYDAATGFHIHALAHLPHKRAAIVRCERVRFFQVVAFAGTAMGGPGPFRSLVGDGRGMLRGEGEEGEEGEEEGGARRRRAGKGVNAKL